MRATTGVQVSIELRDGRVVVFQCGADQHPDKARQRLELLRDSAALEVPCPSCGAAAGDFCKAIAPGSWFGTRVRLGDPIQFHHAKRRWVAKPLSKGHEVPELGRRVRQLRLSLGMSVGELTRRTGWDRSRVVQLENGRSCNPTLRRLQALADALGVTVGYLVDPRPGSPCRASMAPSQGVMSSCESGRSTLLTENSERQGE